jgi:molybdopterin-containing oxidoreductase family membrane subunit
MEDRVDSEVLFRPLVRSGKAYYAFLTLLVAVLLFGGYAYYVQLRDGLAVTGLRNYISWGMYITNFVFFIGISHAGTLISAILRVTGAEWRRPITRMAEAITVFALMVGAPMIIIDMGHPERLLNLITSGRLQSPILWDLISITTYLTGSLLYLYLPLIPDMAACRDRLTQVAGWRKALYRFLAMGWQGTPEQKQRLHKAVSIMAVIIIPIAISVHTVVAWIFAMTLRPGWRSTLFGPYFVAGAIFSGIAALIVAMAIFRRVYHLEKYLEVKHFRNLGILLLVMDVIYIYLTLSEYLTTAYTATETELPVLAMLFEGQFALPFWAMIIGGFILPALLLAMPALIPVRAEPAPGRATATVPQRSTIWRGAATIGLGVLAYFVNSLTTVSADIQTTQLWPMLRVFSVAAAVLALLMLIVPVLRAHPIATVVGASLLINVGMWIKRYVIIVPTMSNPWLPIQNVPVEWTSYMPTWVEWAITAGGFAAFILFYTLFSRLFPIVSMWEVEEETKPVSRPSTALAPSLGD